MMRSAAMSAMAARLNMRSRLKIKTVAFERTEGLLDAPAQSIELNHFIRIREAGYLVSRIQAPMDARLAFWRIHLARFHQCELHSFRKLVQPIVGRASDAHLARTQLDCGSTFLFAGTARCHTDNARSQRFAAREGVEQRSSRTQIAIMGSADNQFDRLRATREQREHIAFPIANHCDRSRLAQVLSGSLTAPGPARRFFLFEWKIPSVRFAVIGSRPDLRVDKSDHRLSFNIYSNHWMNKKTGCFAVTRRSKAAPFFVAAAKVDLTRVLHCQHTTADTLSRGTSTCRLDNRLNRDMRGRQESMCCHFPGARLANLANHNRSQRRDPLNHPFRTLGNANISKAHGQVSRSIRAKTLNLICFYDGISFLHPVAHREREPGASVASLSLNLTEARSRTLRMLLLARPADCSATSGT